MLPNSPSLKRSEFQNRLARPILITGAHGMLGSDLKESFVEWIGKDWVVAGDADSLDITNGSQVKSYLKDLRPSWVVNAAAYTDVDGAEREREKAHAINVIGPKNLMEACSEVSARLFHFSTDYVFSGEGDRPWTEEDPTSPPMPNFYGETKLQGELEVRKLSSSVVLRVQWLYGRKRDRFTPLKTKEVFTPFNDQFGAPEWTKEICKVVAELMARDASGLFHFSYDDHASWLEVYQFVKETLGISVRLEPKKSGEVKLPARRPSFGVLSNKKLLHFLGWKSMGSWKEPLREFLLSAP